MSFILGKAVVLNFVAATELPEPISRIFGLDMQQLVDTGLSIIAVCTLFLALSYLLFNPARELLKKRQDKIQSDMEAAAREKEEGQKFKEEYDSRLKKVDKEVDEILSSARKKAVKQENEIVGEAKEEANRIIQRANKEVELEKSKVKDEVKQEMIEVAALMAGKFVAGSIDEYAQKELVEETLKEMGDETWQS